jgi:hypothetical protein
VLGLRILRDPDPDPDQHLKKEPEPDPDPTRKRECSPISLPLCCGFIFPSTWLFTLSWVWSRITNEDPNQGIGWLIDKARQRGVVDPELYLSDLDPNFPRALNPDPDST